MYARQSHIIRYNLSKYLSTLTLSHTRCYSTNYKDDFKILQVPERIKRQRDHLPGIEKRKKYLQDWDETEALGHNENEAISTNIDAEEFHAMQADFMNLDESYNSHEKEILLKRKLKERYQMRKKHFKEAKQPKLLTVTDMHQIKVLHEQDPNEWTVEKLSASFPATPSIIIKVLKSNTPRSSERMKEHDTQVKHNWALLQTGQLIGLSPDYEHHLSMFSYRDPIVRSMEEYKQFQPPIYKYVPESTEFRSIITSYYDMVKTKKKLNMISDENHINDGINAKQIGQQNSSSVKRIQGNNNMANKNNLTIGISEQQNRSSTKKIQGNINMTNKNNLISKSDNINQAGSLSRRFSTFRSYLSSRITGDGNTTIKTESNSNQSESNSNQVEQSQGEKSQVESELDVSDRSNVNVNIVGATTVNVNANTVSSNEKTDGNVVSSDKIDVSHVFESETSMKESSNEELRNEELKNEETNTFDRNRTMFSNRPKHWREIERIKIQDEIERERVKREAAVDRSTHDGQWRKVARHERQQYTSDFDIQAFNSSQNRPRENRGLRDDNDDMDFDAFNSRNQAGGNAFNSRNHHNSVEARGNTFNSRKNNPFEIERFVDTRDRDHDWDMDGFNSKSNAEANSELFSSKHDGDVSENPELSRDSSTESFNDSNSDSSSSSSTFDRDRRMYPTKPEHWIEIVRQRETTQREKKMVAKKLDEERSDRSMYDGQWRRLRHRREGYSDRRAVLEQEIDARIASLRERRMNTMTNCEEELSEENTSFSQSSPQQEMRTHRENTSNTYEKDSRDEIAGDEMNGGKNNV